MEHIEKISFTITSGKQNQCIPPPKKKGKVEYFCTKKRKIVGRRKRWKYMKNEEAGLYYGKYQEIYF